MSDISLTRGGIVGAPQPARTAVPVVAAGGWAASPPIPGPATATAPEGGGRALRLATEAAAQALHAEKTVEVSSFFDETTGRQIYRVADPVSGQVLSQSPPEELLRLYAAIREDTAPLVEVQA